MGRTFLAFEVDFFGRWSGDARLKPAACRFVATCGEAGKSRLLAELRRWQQQTSDPLADRDKLTRLTNEHDALEKPYVRKTDFRRAYPEYLNPGTR